MRLPKTALVVIPERVPLKNGSTSTRRKYVRRITLPHNLGRKPFGFAELCGPVVRPKDWEKTWTESTVDFYVRIPNPREIAILVW